MHILYFLISRPHQHIAAVAFPIGLLNKRMCHFSRGVSVCGPITTGPSPAACDDYKQISHSLAAHTKTKQLHLVLSNDSPQKQQHNRYLSAASFAQLLLVITLLLHRLILIHFLFTFTALVLRLLNVFSLLFKPDSRIIGRSGRKQNGHDLFMTRLAIVGWDYLMFAIFSPD